MKPEKPDETAAQTIDAETGNVDPSPRRIDLSSLRDVRLEMAAVYREVDRGKIDSRDGARRAYILGRIADVITVAEIEKRLEDLEARRPGSGGSVVPLRAVS